MMSRAPTRRMILSSARVLTLAAAACTLALAAAVSGGGDDPAPVEAPAAFDELTNGFDTPAEFAEHLKAFKEEEDAEKDGLGPVYNATSCVSCHQNPITGGSSQIAEIRAGHHIFDPNNPNPRKVRFEEPPGGSVIQQRAINPLIQEVVRPEDDVRTFRMSNSILGNGYVEVIPDEDILKVRDGQYRWGMQGFAVVVPVAVEARKGADGKTEFISYERIGRFGWKCQEASLLNFSAGAYITEMGITNPMQPEELTSNGRPVKDFDISKKPDPEDVTKEAGDPEEHLFGVDVEAFTRFMRSTKAAPRDEKTVGTADVVAGEALFRNNNLLGCAVCHQPDYTTPPVGTPIRTLDGKRGSDMATVPQGLGGKIIHPYSDFLLHDIGTGDGIAQTQHADLPPRGYEKTKRLEDVLRKKYRVGRVETSNDKADRRVLYTAPAPDQPAPASELDQRTANKIRTAPLWGLRVRPQLMHNGLSLTIEDAIRRHAGQAEGVRLKYETLSSEQKKQLLAFLNSL
jgi:CxxC motif-containing protein (DUF1111 family)